MKKRLAFLIINLILFKMFAAGFENSKKFDADSVSNFNISLYKEDFTVSTYNGNEICIISEADEKSILPFVKLENSTLLIKHADYPDDKKCMCSISLFLPENFKAGKVSIKTPLGKMDIKQLSADSVILEPGPDNSLKNIKTDYFEIPIPDPADINISNLDSKEINIRLMAGTLNLSLSRIPEKNSHISSKQGNLNILFPKNDSFSINSRSFYSKLINNLDNSVTDWIREGKTYKHNGGGVEIMLQTHTGDIIIGE